MRTRLVTPLLIALALTSCSSRVDSDDALDDAAAPAVTASTAPTEALAATPSDAPSEAPAPTRTGAATATASASAAPAKGAPSPSATAAVVAGPKATSAPGTAAQAKATKPGTYTYSSSGTVTLGTGAPQKDEGTATLKVSPYRNGTQHSTLERETTGTTEQDLLVRDRGTYLASLVLTTPAFTKEFRPNPAVLLVPDPAKVGATWSWGGQSTDGKTNVKTTNKVVRTETLTVNGQKVPCVVLQTTLTLTGDVDYKADVTTWWAPSFRLPVKDHTVGKGTYNGFPFSSDSTSVLRSTTPA